ncbi:MAG TPA: acyl-CoA dehydrogenase family protein [Pseudonocardiaceae bacterium]|nr:acyl-CoA dehydrogenase family protein [Pseudonocardiaceae bacterium]
MLLPTEDQDLLRAITREVLTEQAGSPRLRALLDTPTGHDADLWKQLAELGWPALALDAELPDLAVVIEECGRALMPSALTGTTATTWLLTRHEVALPGLADGTAIVAWSIGTHNHVPDAGVATHFLVDVPGSDLAAIPANAPGLSIHEERTIDLTRRYHELRIEHLPTAGLIPGATELFQCGVVLQCAESIGVAARALDMTREHVGNRIQFGRAIGSFQAVKHRIADLYIALEGARVATRDAAEAVQRGRTDAAYAVHVAKSWTGRAASAITSEAIQLHGGIGFTWEHDLHLLQRRAKANELLLGTPAWHDEQLTGLIEAQTWT